MIMDHGIPILNISSMLLMVGGVKSNANFSGINPFGGPCLLFELIFYFGAYFYVLSALH